MNLNFREHLKTLLCSIKNDPEVKELFYNISKLSDNTKSNRLKIGINQEKLLSECSGGKLKLTSDDPKENQLYGDFIFEGEYLDLKIAQESDKYDYISTISKPSIESFLFDGYYLCFNFNWSKIFLIPHSDLIDRINSGDLKYYLFKNGKIKRYKEIEDKSYLALNRNASPFLMGKDLERVFKDYVL